MESFILTQKTIFKIILEFRHTSDVFGDIWSLPPHYEK
jgi:hypothetical protein